MNQPIPINEAEAVFETFYDPLRSGLKDWQFSCEPGTDGSCSQEWQGARIAWRSGRGRVVGRLARTLDLDISRYGCFMIRCSLAETCTLTVRARTDGKPRMVIARAAGRNIYYEYEGPLPGRRLQALEIEIRAQSDSPGQTSLFWLGLADRTRRQAMLARPSPYDGRWEGLIRPESDMARLAPQLALFFNGRELAAIRRKIQTPYYRVVMDRLRAQARKALSGEPHRQIGDYPIVEESGKRYDRTRALAVPSNQRLGSAMAVCSFVGLVDQDFLLLRAGLSQALAAAHCTYWDDSFMQTLPGGCWDHRAFKAFALTQWFVRAWDWAGSLLTPAGTALMARTLSLKALPLFQMSLEKYGYMRQCNQAIVFATGAILGHAALARVWDYGGERLDVALEALSESVRNYTEPDGGAHEGLEYFNWSYASALEGYLAAARVKGVPVRRLVPACMLKTPRYLMNILSTVAPAGCGINVADGGRPGRGPAMGMLAALMTLTDDPYIRAFWAATRRVREPRHATGAIDDILYGPVRLPRPKADPPVFSRLPCTGMICSNRPVVGGSIRLQVIGAKAGAGHTHQDKGSFVLEAFGEELLIDRGICYYGDARAGSMKRADQHNMITPHDAEGRTLPALCPCPQAILPIGRGDARRFRARVDGTAQWPDHLAQWVRTFSSPAPHHILVTDTVARRQKGAVTFHAQSRFPWKRTQKGWTTQGQRGRVTVIPEWVPKTASGSRDGVDGAIKPVYHLSLTTCADTSFRLKTHLHVERVGT
jgi:hypothetical protein